MTASRSPVARISYVELLGRSNFSFLQGASHPEEMVTQAQSLGYDGFALCDINGLYGVVRAHQAIHNPSHFVVNPTAHDLASKDFKFIVGCELTLIDKSSIALLPMNKYGYVRLCQLITLAKRESSKNSSCLTLEDILHHADDLIALPLPPWNYEKLKKLQQAFFDRLYLPIWRDFSWESIQICNQAFEIERQLKLPLVVTQRPFMHISQRKPILDVLTCSLHKTNLYEAKTRLASNSERYLKPLSDLQEIWKDRPDLLQASCLIADCIHFSLHELFYQYPKAVVPKNMTNDQFLHQLVEEGLKWRYPQGVPENVRKTALHELEIIKGLAYEDYFLTLWDICQFAKQKNIMFQGRGSAANSVVCYALGLTSVDPSQIELLFERFLSKERGEPPDIDIDFESQRREEVLQYVYQAYGNEHAAMVSTVICYRSRMALREVAKAFAIDEKTISEFGRIMGRDGFEFLLKHPEKLLAIGLTPQKAKWLLTLSKELIGFPRHMGIHTGGFVIAQRPVTECVPIEKATMENRYVVQWNKDDLDYLKMMKIDLLGLGMLTALRKSFEILKESKNIDLSLATIPADDKRTYEMVQKADTVGVFQIESRAQMSLIPRLKPTCFYDLVVEVAIVRPGPLQGGMVHPYIRRRHGLEKPFYAHPALEKILGKTLGVPIFQEQIMQMAVSVCGFTPGEADELRRVMSSSWKRKDVMEGLRLRLINGMLAHNIDRAYAEQIYKTIQGFASYGFPESHAASFALLTYASSYIKCHYPDVFVCALLNSQPMGFYAPRTLIADAQRHNVKFAPLDVQKSFYDYHLEENNLVRVGFRSIFGFREEQAQTIETERQKGGPFKDFSDFVCRTHLPKASLMKLASAGAFECFHLPARQALWSIQALNLDRNSLLFGKPKETFDSDGLNIELPQESPWETLRREYEILGHSIHQHPLRILRPVIQSQAQRQKSSLPYYVSKDMLKVPNGKKIRVAGLISVRQKPPTAKGFTFLTLEDEFGFFNIVIRPPVYKRCRETINFYSLVEVTGFVEKNQGVINIKAEDIKGLTKTNLEVTSKDWG